MAVAYDNSVTTGGDGVTNLTTGSFTISGSNRVATISFSAWAITVACTGFSGSVGGVSATQITGTNTGLQSEVQTNIMGVIAPPTGSQTGTMSWTNACTADIAVMTATGADQTTPFTNGTFANGSGTTASVTISSTSGDMTQDVTGDRANDIPSSPSQTQRWATNDFATIAGSTAAGSASNVHSWTITSSAWVSSGVNIAQVAAGGGTTITGLGKRLQGFIYSQG
jgi:hypothetical protein